MGWSIGFVGGRDVGYGVPAVCEHPECDEEIDRGLSFACGEFPDSEYGCGLFFCGEHMMYAEIPDEERLIQCCDRCQYRNENPDKNWKDYPEPYKEKPDVEEWIEWKLTDKSWKQWRKENPKEVSKIKKRLAPNKD